MWFVGLERVLWVFPFISLGSQKRYSVKGKSLQENHTFIFEECCKKKLASNALVGHLLTEWICWSSLSTYLSRVKRELYTEDRMKQLYVIWFGKGEFSVPQVDIEEGSLNIRIITLTKMAGFHKKRPCQQENQVWTSKKVGQERSKQSFSSVSGRNHSWFSKKMLASSMASRLPIHSLYFWSLEGRERPRRGRRKMGSKRISQASSSSPFQVSPAGVRLN